MTIVEAIKQVLQDSQEGMTYPVIYKKILEKKLYTFGAKDPQSIVRSKLRQHCYGADFPSASPTKHFVSDGKKGNKALYRIWNGKVTEIPKSKDVPDSESPEELIDKYYKAHIKNIENQIMDGISNSEPGFFEQLLIKLLIRLGYGWDSDKAGIHTGGPNDRGVDGIIYEDQLGLERVYLQAKRYKKTKSIGPADIQQFIGAMNTKNANKGVYITSSYFTKAAKEEARDARNISLVLIDREKLSELLRKNGLGVSVAETYKTYTIDSDAFRDN